VATRQSFSIAAIVLLGIIVMAVPASGQTPFISTLPGVIDVGDNFFITGSNFNSESEVNFFVATSTGAINFGPFVPWSLTTTRLGVFVPLSVSQGAGVVSVQVVNTNDIGFVSNTAYALLEGSDAAGSPSLTGINGAGLSPTSLNPGIALANVETVVIPGTSVTLTGRGLDTDNGVAVDIFCGCPPLGKVGPFYFGRGTPGLSSAGLTFSLPSGTSGPATGPGAIRLTNLGNFLASAAVSVPIGARITVTSVTQTGSTVTVNGTGFSPLTVINLFNERAGSVINLGGLDKAGNPNIILTFISDKQMTFTLPAGVSGPAYVQALNPPFIPFTSSGDSPGGAFDAT
jgi:hypothetical protein